MASLGGITTTVNPLYTTDELAQQMRDGSARYLLTVGPLLDKAAAAAQKAANVQEVFAFGEVEGATPFASLLTAAAEPPNVDIDPERDLVTLPYSSGRPTAQGRHAQPSQSRRTVDDRRGSPQTRVPDETDTLLAFRRSSTSRHQDVNRAGRGATIVAMCASTRAVPVADRALGRTLYWCRRGARNGR